MPESSSSSARRRFGDSAYRRSSNFRTGSKKEERAPFTPTRKLGGRTSASAGSASRRTASLGAPPSSADATSPRPASPTASASSSSAVTSGGWSTGRDEELDEGSSAGSPEDRVRSAGERWSGTVVGKIAWDILNESESSNNNNHHTASSTASDPLVVEDDSEARQDKTSTTTTTKSSGSSKNRSTGRNSFAAAVVDDDDGKTTKMGSSSSSSFLTKSHSAKQVGNSKTNPFAADDEKDEAKTGLLKKSSSAKIVGSNKNPFAREDDDDADAAAKDEAAPAVLLRSQIKESPWASDVAKSRKKKQAAAAAAASSTTNPFADDGDDRVRPQTSAAAAAAVAAAASNNPFAETDETAPRAKPKHRELKSDELSAWLSTPSKSTKPVGDEQQASTPATVPSTPVTPSDGTTPSKHHGEEVSPALDETSVTSNDSSVAAVAEDGWGRQNAAAVAATAAAAVQLNQQQDDDDDDDDEASLAESESSLDAVAEEGWGLHDAGAVAAAILRDEKKDDGAIIEPAGGPARADSFDRAQDRGAQMAAAVSEEEEEPECSGLERPAASWNECGTSLARSNAGEGGGGDEDEESTSLDRGGSQHTANTTKEDSVSVISGLTRSTAGMSAVETGDSNNDDDGGGAPTSLRYTKRRLYGGRFYQDPAEAMAVLTMIESKRQLWFQSEMEATQKEWKLYKKWLRTMVRELSVVEKLVRNSHRAFLAYSQTMGAVCSDSLVNDDGEELSKKEKSKAEKNRVGTSAKCDPGHMPLLDPLIHAFSVFREELDSHVPLMEDNEIDARDLREEVANKAKELEAAGSSLGWARVEAAEENIRDTFDHMLQVIMCHDSKGAMPVTDEQGPSDRWLAESSYRHSAHLGLLTWKDNRRDYQNVYAEIIELENYRQERMKQLLLSFLSRRRRLAGSAYGALIPGAQLLKVNAKSKRQESQTIEDELQKLMESFGSDSSKAPAASDTKGYDSVDPFGEDAWESSYVTDRRVMSLKVGKDWKSAVAVKTLDHSLHFFVADDPADGEDGGKKDAHNPFAAPTVADITRSVTTPIPEFSIKPSDEFDLTIAKKVVELKRAGRSKIFRKKEDLISVKFASERAAAQWVESLRDDDNSFYGSRLDV